MKKLLRSMCLVVACSLLPAGWVLAQTNSLPITTSTTLPTWTQSIVKIQYKVGPGNDSIFTGTGVIISRSGYVLTAAHVGKGLVRRTVISIGQPTSVYAAPSFQYTATEVAQLPIDNKQDLKLLKINNPNNVQFPAATFATVAPFPGNDISVAGYPDLPFRGVGLLGALSIYKTTILSGYSDANTNIPTRLHYGGGAMEGFSGGPVFNDRGHLLGIHSGRVTANLENLLKDSDSCNDAPGNSCFGNVLRFPVMGPGNQTRTQTVAINYYNLKSVLDNYCWGTSIWKIPQVWINRL